MAGTNEDAAAFARWLVANEDKRDTPEFKDVAAAFGRASATGPTMGQKLAASTPGSVLYGAARLPYGALQLGADIGDGIVTATGGKPVLGGILRDKLRDFQEYRAAGDPGVSGELAAIGGEMAFGGLAGKGLKAAASGVGKVLQGAAGGFAAGAIQPTTGDDPIGDRLAPAAVGTAVGAAFPVGVPLVRAILERFTKRGRDAVQGRILLEAAGDRKDRILAELQANANPVGQGSAGEVATAAGSAEFSALQRRMEQRLPSEYGDLARNQNDELVARIRTVSGDDDALEAAKAARDKAVNPLYASARGATATVDAKRTINLLDRIVDERLSNDASGVKSVVENVRKTLFEYYPAQKRAKDAWDETRSAIAGVQASGGKVPPELVQLRQLLFQVKDFQLDEFVALERIKALKATTPEAANAIDFAKRQILTPDYVVEQNPRRLISASQSIGRLLDTKSGDNAVATLVRRELSTIKRSLDLQIGKVVPDYKAAANTFASMSKPIDQLEVGQYLENKLVSSINEFGANAPATRGSFATAVRDAPGTVARATGFKRAPKLSDVLTPQAEQSIREIGADLARKSDFDRLAVAGTPNINRQLGELYGERAPGMISHTVTIINAIAKATGVRATNVTLDDLARVMLDPQKTAQILARASDAERRNVIGAIQSMAAVGGAAAGAEGDAKLREAVR